MSCSALVIPSEKISSESCGSLLRAASRKTGGSLKKLVWPSSCSGRLREFRGLSWSPNGRNWKEEPGWELASLSAYSQSVSRINMPEISKLGEKRGFAALSWSKNLDDRQKLGIAKRSAEVSLSSAILPGNCCGRYWQHWRLISKEVDVSIDQNSQ